MKILYGFLADAARVESGKLHVIGGNITVLWRNEFPAMSNVAVVFSVEHRPSEVGRPREIRILVNDADGRPVFGPIDGEMIPRDLPDGAPRGAPLQSPHAIDIHGPVFPSTGQYAVEILIDGNSEHSIPFVVAEHPLAAAA
jgi:hypothetical protein